MNDIGAGNMKKDSFYGFLHIFVCDNEVKK